MKKLLLLPALLTVSLLAQTFNVSTTPELRTALQNAASNGEDDTIVLADGTYKTTDDGQGTFIYLSNEANKLTLQGSSSENVILSGDNQHQIFNHTVTLSSNLTLDNLTFLDGNNSITDYGGGVYTTSSIVLTNCKFLNNNAKSGAGFQSGRGKLATVKNSYFENNTANYAHGGGFWAMYAPAIVQNSIFINNSAVHEGGGFCAGSVDVEGSVFKRNSANYGGGLCSFNNTYTNVSTSIFESNTGNQGGGVHSSCSKSNIQNSLFKNNDIAIALTRETNQYILNNIFIDSSNKDILAASTSIVTINNNYIDENNIDITSFKSNNIFNVANLGFVDEANGDYNLTSLSDLIDAGTIDITGITFPTTDLNGNARIVGGSIDIGPYEFSTTRPTINSVSYIGIAKEQSLLTFSVDYTLASGRAINTIEYDYANNGSWSTASTHTFNTAGAYTVNVKVTDSEGEFSSTSKVVTIVALAFSEMTDAQKLIKAMDPVYYDAVVAIIEAQKASANTSGYELGTYDGTQLVIATPDTYGINVVVPLQVANVNALPLGWSMIAIPATITNMSIFSSVKVVWYFKNNLWSAYSPNSTTAAALTVAGITTLTTLPANSAVWVEK